MRIAGETLFQAKEISKNLSVEIEKLVNMSKSLLDETEEYSNADSDLVDVRDIDSEMDNDDNFSSCGQTFRFHLQFLF